MPLTLSSPGDGMETEDAGDSRFVNDARIFNLPRDCEFMDASPEDAYVPRNARADSSIFCAVFSPMPGIARISSSDMAAIFSTVS